MPSFVSMTGPGTAVVTDDAAVAITAQTAALTGALTAQVALLIGTPVSPLPGTLSSINLKLELIAKQLSVLVEHSKTSSASISDLSVAQSALVNLQQESNMIQTMAVSDQIDTNRFQTQVTNEALDRAGIPRPKTPPFLDTLKETIKKIKDFNVLVEAEGLMKSATDKLTGLLKEQLKLFDASFGISEYIKKKLAVIKSALTPPSPKQIRDAIEAKTVVDWSNVG
jgi:hypothetical protein